MYIQHALIVAKSILSEAYWDKGNEFNLPGFVFEYKKNVEPFALVIEEQNGSYVCWVENEERRNSVWVNVNNLTEDKWRASLKLFKEHSKFLECVL